METRTYYKSAEVQKQADGTYEFVASDETVDRYGDIVRVSGWDLKNYRKNPIVLFGHRHDTPVGVATRVWVEGTKLMARIKLAEQGTSPFIDTLRKLLEQKIIRAVSVGFRPLEEPKYIRDPKNDRITGLEFISQELLENSLVSVPANPSALAAAKSMGISEQLMERVFSPARRAPDALVQLAQNKAILEMAKLGASGNR